VNQQKPPDLTEVGMPADPRDMIVVLASLKAQGIRPKWADRAEEKIAEYQRRLEFERPSERRCVMRPPETVYRGKRTTDRGRIKGVSVTVDGRELSPEPSWHLRNHSPTGFEWGYGGSGPAQLALALVYDATGNRDRALVAYQWFKWATVATWQQDEWEITAADIFRWLDRHDRESEIKAMAEQEAADSPTCVAVRRCRICGCTDDDCSQCIAATGKACRWVEGEPDLCSRCDTEAWLRGVFGERPAPAREGGGL